MKRVLSFTLAVLLVCLLNTPFADAKGELTEGNFVYTVNDEGAEIIEYKGSSSKVTIPETLGGKTVVSISGEVFFDNEYLTEIVIADTVKYIGKACFAYCYDLQRVSLPADLNTIGEGAFAYCNNLESVSFPEGLKTIEDMAFFDCEQFRAVYIPESVAKIGEGAFALCYYNEHFAVHPDNANYSALDSVLYNKDMSVLIAYPVSKADTEFDVPDSVLKIDNYAFCNSLNIQRVNMYEVENIGDYAFSDCGKLSSVQIPHGLRTMGVEAFQNTALSGISVPETVIMIGTHAFGYEYNFKENIYLPLANFKVYGKYNSIAQWCAKKNGFYFVGYGVSSKGDYNDDGKVDIIDVALMRAEIIGTITADVDARSRSDINNDGIMNIVDVAGVRSWIANFG